MFVILTLCPGHCDMAHAHYAQIQFVQSPVRKQKYNAQT